MDPRRSEAVKIAQAEVGPQIKGSARVFDYWREVLPASWQDAQVKAFAKTAEWCGGFALWVLHEAKITQAPWLVSVGFVGPLGLHKTNAPQPGDVAIKASPFWHHAIVEGYDQASNTLITIDGNQPDVRRKVRPMPTGITFYSIGPLLGEEGAAGPKRPTLRFGSTGPDVKILQARLGIDIDGSYGPATQAAVKQAQRDANLIPDGVVGPDTWVALGFSVW